MFPTPKPAGMSPASAVALLLLAAFFWGAGNVANKTVLEHVGPLTAVGLRCLIAVLVILPLALREGASGAGVVADRAWITGAAKVSLWFAIAMGLQQIAYQTATVTNASFLITTTGILTPILAWCLHGDRPGLRIVIAAPLTLLGAFLMAGATFRPSSLNPGDIACLMSAVFYAGWTVALGRQAMVHGRPFATTLLQFGVTGMLMLPLSLATETTTAAAVRAALPELLLLGVFSTALAFALVTCAQRFVSASTAAILVSAESLFGAAGAFLILGEVTPVTGIAGAALILGGIVLVAVGMRTTPSRQGRPDMDQGKSISAKTGW